MKINPRHYKCKVRRHYKCKVRPRRFLMDKWAKYYAIKKKDKLDDQDKYWLKQFRAALKLHKNEVTLTHQPTGTTINTIVEGKIALKDLIAKLVLKVRAARAELKKTKTTSKSFDGARYELVGGVFPQGAQVNEIAKRTSTHDPYSPKVPRRKDKNYIGIELEFNQLPNVGQSAIANALKAAGLARYVDVTTDGSCGWEVRVLLTEDDFEQPLTKIMKVISDLGHKTDTRCGTHVHFDMRNRDVKTVYENLFKTQNCLRKFIPRSRKYNTFCRRNVADTFDKQMGLGRDERYYGINVQAYNRHKTLEVRMHQGTLNPNELVPWIKLLTKIVNHKPVITEKVNTLRQAKKQFDIDENLAKNLESRILTVFGRVLDMGA